jgi:hypothetical protein
MCPKSGSNRFVTRLLEASSRTDDVTFSEAGGAAVAPILHLLRLVSAELVLHHGLDVGRFEVAARKKIDEFTSPTTNQQARDAGFAFAHHLLEQLHVQISAQAEVKRSNRRDMNAAH